MAFHSVYDNFLVKQIMRNINVDDAVVDAVAFIDMELIHRGAFFLTRGAAGAAETIDTIQLVQATAVGGTGVKAISGTALAVETGFLNATDLCILELDAVVMDFENGFTFASIEVGGSGDNTDVFVDCTFIGLPRYAHENLNLNAADLLLNFSKKP